MHRRRLILLLLGFSLACFGQDDVPSAYVVRLTGSWNDEWSGKRLAPLSLLYPKTRLRSMDATVSEPAANIRFFNNVCETPITCSAGGSNCGQAIALSSVTKTCSDNTSWMKSVEMAWHAFFRTTGSRNPALALTLSRSADDDGETLREAILFSDAGRIEPGPLFKGTPGGRMAVQFCEVGPTLTEECTGTDERDRIPITVVSGKVESAPFTKPDGLYRARLWKMTPRGMQPTETTALALIGPRSKLNDQRLTFEQITQGVEATGKTDPMLRLMLGAWLEQARKDLR